MRSAFRSTVPLAAMLLALTACKDKVTDPGGTPTTLEKVTDAPSTGVVNSVVNPAPSFVVKNENGQPMKADITIAVTAGGGSLVGQPTKSNLSATGIGTWTLGKTVGANTVTVTVGNLTPITFTVPSTTPLAAKKLAEINPQSRVALANAVLTQPVIVAVQDTFDNGIAGQSVSFSILAGGGSLSGSATGTTDASGQVTAPSWRLGKSADGANAQKLRAVSGNLSPLDVSASVQTNYNILVRFFGSTSMTPSQQATFTRAAQRIMGVITGDVADIQLNNTDISSCASGESPLTEIADDVIIYAQGKNIDGVGNILGSARVCFVRSSTATCAAGCANIPVIGLMEFDVADLTDLETRGSLQDVITHEMLHVVGVGALWQTFGLVSGTGTADPRYTGAQGTAGCQSVGGTVSCASSVPVENIGQSGTRDVHWRETTFVTELMTGQLNTGSNPFSALTVSSLADFGYVINAGDYDAYTIAAGAIIAASSTRTLVTPPNWERINEGPIYSIDLFGTVKLLRNP